MKERTAPAVQTRSQAVDLVKTVAICGVLMVHVTAPALTGGETGSPPWLCALLWACVSHMCVPLFLMTSGALLLDPARPLTLKKLYTKNFPRLLAALLFWAVCYKLFALCLHGMTVPGLIQAAKEVVLFRHEEHLYYLHIMLLVYAFVPITRLLADHADRRQLEYLLGLWFLLGILYPTVRTFWPFTLLVGIPKQWLMNMTYASIGYTLLGRYITAYHARGRRPFWILSIAAGAAMAFFGCWAASMAAGQADTHFLEGMGVPMWLLAVGIYGLCQSASIPAGLRRTAEYLSKASFCVFLTHIFFLKAFSRLGVNALMGPVAVTAPLVAALLLGCGCLVYEVLRRVPVVREYLI